MKPYVDNVCKSTLPLTMMITGRKLVTILALAACIQAVFVGLGPCLAAEEAAVSLTDQKGRTLHVIILAVDENQVRARRQNDSREFLIPTTSLSEATREKLRHFQKPDHLAAKPQDATAKPPVEASISEELLSYFRNQWEATKNVIPNIEAANAAFSSQHLTQLIALEQNLVVAASPKDPPVPIVCPSGVAIGIMRDMEEMRQSIRDADRERIFAAADLEPEKRIKKKPKVIDRSRLDEMYDRAVKSWKKQQAGANKAMVREQKAPRPNQDTITSLEKQAKGAGESIAMIHEAFYGFKPGKWMDHEPGWHGDHPAEILRKEISTLRKAIHAKLVEAANHSGEAEYRSAEIDGVSVYSSNFGVILDTSGSMTAHIEPLKKEIEKGFQSPVYREVMGCSLMLVSPNQARAGMRPLHIMADTLSCIEEMLLVYKVDTIYWFCDLNDPREEAALRRLGELLRMSGAKFYVRSVGKRPDGPLEALMDDF